MFRNLNDALLGFMPKKVRALVEKDGVVSKRDWECALLTAIRDEIRIGNMAAQISIFSYSNLY